MVQVRTSAARAVFIFEKPRPNAEFMKAVHAVGVVGCAHTVFIQKLFQADGAVTFSHFDCWGLNVIVLRSALDRSFVIVRWLEFLWLFVK